MCKNDITMLRAWFYELTEHACQHCTMCNNKYGLPEFTRLPIILSLYYYSISET